MQYSTTGFHLKCRQFTPGHFIVPFSRVITLEIFDTAKYFGAFLCMYMYVIDFLILRTKGNITVSLLQSSYALP